MRGMKIDNELLDRKTYKYAKLDNYLWKLKARYEQVYSGKLSIDFIETRRNSGIEPVGVDGRYAIHIGVKQAIEDKSVHGYVSDSDIVMTLVSFAHELVHYDQILRCLKDGAPDSVRLSGQILMPRIRKEHYARTYHLNVAENDAEYRAYAIAEAWCKEAFPEISSRFRDIVSECAKLEPLDPEKDLFRGIKSFNYINLRKTLGGRATEFDNTPVRNLFRLGADSAIMPGLDDHRSKLWLRIQGRERLRVEYESYSTSLEQERMLYREALNAGIMCLMEFPVLRRVLVVGDLSIYGVKPGEKAFGGREVT